MPSRRGVGLGAFTGRGNAAQAYSSHGSQLKSANAASLLAQREVIQSLLHNYAVEHADAIKSNPSFRAEFARMCHAVGVDPLAGTNARGKKADGLRAKVFGADLKDFYCSVAVRVVELCQRTVAENGGLIGVVECCESVKKGKAIGGGLQVSEDDIKNAVKSLEPLKSGFTIITIANKDFIRSIPKELNTDQSTVLEILQLLGNITVSLLRINLNWPKARAQTVIDDLLADSLVWVDKQCPEWEYWSPQGLLDED
ncbi:ESCRT II complex subunit Dot2 [Knufia obscura]|uniref:ESCRT II complex subunit Dot2 n=2 Tax=Knufia TaxID=430999 RepID=A0AAN8E940_9EURO|nr:ESCRT II complex subunit Dot2 [Knufia obscura]KAK5949454.1 ESCRT II complex subunit Dot2 [Knufia fluminis]